MKKHFLLPVLLLLCSFTLDAKKIPGQIFFDHGIVDVTLVIPLRGFEQGPNYEKLQNRIVFYDSTGKKKVLKPGGASEVRFSCNNENIRLLSRRNSFGAKIISQTQTIVFLKLEVDGELKLFLYFAKVRIQGGGISGGGVPGTGFIGAGIPMGTMISYQVEHYVLQRDNEDLVRPRKLYFKKDMMEYFDDCPILLEKIEHKEFKYDDLETIVKYYHANCGK